MNYNMRLGVCIPTYKRPEQLRRCVLSIIKAAKSYDVPIFIADDATDDTNAAVMAELQRGYPHIVYRKNESNLGIDGNILHSVDICDCDYAWLIGEDDRMVPEAIATVLPILDRETPSFVAVNYSYVDENIEIVLRERLIPIDQDKTTDSAAFVREDAWAIGFIGGCVINKHLWQRVEPAQYIGTYFAHVGVILESIAGKSVEIIARPLILNRVGSAEVVTWSGDAYGVFHGWGKVTRLLEPIYGADVVQASAESFDRNHGLNTVRFLMAKRADRLYDIGIYRKFIKKGRYGRTYKIAAFVVAWMPPFPFRGLRDLLSFIRHRRNHRLSLP
jgi:glycosyltransferase involved in cell wall biosynthesis